MIGIPKSLAIGIALFTLAWAGDVLGRTLPGATPETLNMNISATCKNGDATFTITNKDEAWPAVANLAVFLTADAKRVHKRRIRLAQGQRATFRVLGTTGGRSELGLWVNPSWFKRPFDYDTTIICR